MKRLTILVLNLKIVNEVALSQNVCIGTVTQQISGFTCKWKDKANPDEQIDLLDEEYKKYIKTSKRT